MHDALMSIEKVADYINEMQRISETYTPLFQDMCKESDLVDNVDVSVDNLLHYGRASLVNTMENSKLASSMSSRKSLSSSEGAEPDYELMVFIYKKAVILIDYEQKQPLKKINSSPGSSMNSKCSADLKFYTLIPISNLLLRDHAWSDNANSQVWEIVDSSEDLGDEEVVYVFKNRTSEEKKVFVNAIKESKKLNKISNSSALLGNSRNTLKSNSLSRETSQKIPAKAMKPPLMPKPALARKGSPGSGRRLSGEYSLRSSMNSSQTLPRMSPGRSVKKSFGKT